MPRAAVDLLVQHADELVSPPTAGPRAGASMDELLVLRDGALAIRGDRIVETGTTDDLLKRYEPRETLNASGCFVLPGFVDAHTHPLFVRTREQEFDQRVRGLSYEEITRQGGGIFRSVADLHAASDSVIEENFRMHLDAFLMQGSTTIEAKSGYGLTWEHERRCLEILRRSAANHRVHVVPTFLGAHQCPKEFQGRRADFVSELCERMIPEVVDQGLAQYCDVFCDVGAFTVEESRTILEAARARSMGLRIHAEELGPSGGAALACELHAATADHLVHVAEPWIERMRESGVQPVLLPGTVFSLGWEKAPPARAMLAQGLAVVLATDFNPGTCYLQSPPLLIALACQILKMTVAESLTAVTANAAASLGLGGECGALLPGMRADAVVLRGSSHLLLGYRLGANGIKHVIAGGRVVDLSALAPSTG